MINTKKRVGDSVRVLDGANTDDYFGAWVEDMNEFIDQTGEIIEIIGGRGARISGLSSQTDPAPEEWIFDLDRLELIERKEIK